MFGSLLSGAGPILGQLLDDVIPILSYCLNAEEPELRLQYVCYFECYVVILKCCLQFYYSVNSAVSKCFFNFELGEQFFFFC